MSSTFIGWYFMYHYELMDIFYLIGYNNLKSFSLMLNRYEFGQWEPRGNIILDGTALDLDIMPRMK